MAEIRITLHPSWDIARRKKAIQDRAHILKGCALKAMILEKKDYPDIDYDGHNEDLEVADSILIKFE